MAKLLQAPTLSASMSSDPWTYALLRECAWHERGIPSTHGPPIIRKPGRSQLFAFYDVHGDFLEGVIHKRKISRDILQAWERLRRCYPSKERIYLVMDNLSSHYHETLTHFARKHRVTLVSTTRYASWLNLIEAQFTALKSFCSSNSDDLGHHGRRIRIYRYLPARNREKAKRPCGLSIYRRYYLEERSLLS